MASPRRLLLRAVKWLMAMIFAGITAAALLAGGLYLYLEPELPPIEELRNVQLQEPLRVYAASGELMGVFGTQRRVPLEIAEIPEQMRDAFIAAEDDRFYEHPGVDWMGITRAAWKLAMTGEKGQGGSTITMQVARNFFLSREKTYLRKLNEILLALKIERELSKEEVLELYLNKIYLGQRAYGVGAAAQVYYGKPVDELTLAETAVIAGLPTAPSYTNPVVNPERARQRRNYVLRRMHSNGMIDQAALAEALAAPITATSHSAPVELHAPYVAEMARLEATERFGDDVYTNGYRVYTTIDAEEQRAATRSLRDALIAYEARHGYRGRLAFVDGRRVPPLEDLQRMVESIGGSVEEADEEPTAEPPRADEGAVGLPAGVLGLEQLDMVLARHDAVGHLEPAIVVKVEDDRAVVYRSGRRIDPMAWETMAWAAPRREGGGTGAEPEEPADVVAPGDIIHVAPAADENKGVRLAQAPGVEGALVALDPDAGGIRALAGGFDFDRSKFNRVTQARRQPGSNFKPFVYAAALNQGFTPATLVNDAPVVFDDPALEDTWRPENYSGRIFGPTRLREGLVHSRNLVSIRVLLEIGIPYAVDYLERFGFPREQLPHDLTLALGSASLSPLQVATGYATFANGGFRVEPYLVTRIADGAGEEVYRANPARVCPEPCEERQALEEAAAEADGGEQARAAEETRLEEEGRPEELAVVGVPDEDRVPEPRFAERVLPEQDAYIVRSLLRDVARRGTARGTRVLDRDDLGGKTGTTDDQQDAWFSGFNDSVVATAWVGYDQLESLGPYETGARAALPMWIDFMRVALADTPEVWPDLPPGMVTVRIDPETGEYAGPGDDDAIFEIFRSENAPEPTSTARRDSDSGSGDGGGSSEPLF